MPRELEAIFFDVDDTLFSTTEFALRARRAAVRAMRDAGLDHPLDRLERELEEVVGEFSSNYGNHFDKLLLRVPPGCHAGTNPALIVAAGVIAYHRTKTEELTAYPDARELLERLAGTRLVRGIITAGLAIKQAEKLIRLDLVRYLTPRAIFISEQIGISKPNVKLYGRACDAVGVDPTRAMYVGDNPESDVAPPRRLGMITVRLRRSGKYRDVPSPEPPHYEVARFDELARILERDFEVPLAEPALARPGVDA